MKLLTKALLTGTALLAATAAAIAPATAAGTVPVDGPGPDNWHSYSTPSH